MNFHEEQVRRGLSEWEQKQQRNLMLEGPLERVARDELVGSIMRTAEAAYRDGLEEGKRLAADARPTKKVKPSKKAAR